MSQGKLKKYLLPFVALLALFLTLRFLLPVALPFLLGWLLARSAEPLVRLLHQKVRIPRVISSFLCITLALLITALLLVGLCALLLRALGDLAGVLPDLENATISALDILEKWLLSQIRHAPVHFQPFLDRWVQELFSGSSAVLDRITSTVLNFASAFFKALPDRVLSLGTWILSSYMISARFPRIHLFFRCKLPQVWYQKYLPHLKTLKKVLFGWLVAQLKLSGIILFLLLAGFLLLHIPYAPVWAVCVCFVDILPVLGTGTVLIPWAFLCLLQAQQLRAIGLLSLYGVISLARSVLEPRLIGKQLGLDPLVTLVALYAGFRLWGILGMLAAPLLAVAATQLAHSQEK